MNICVYIQGLIVLVALTFATADDAVETKVTPEKEDLPTSDLKADATGRSKFSQNLQGYSK